MISTDYSFSASYNQDKTWPTRTAGNYGTEPLGISAYYEGRAYGPSVVQNPNGTLTMVFAGYRFPKSIPSAAGTALGTGSPQWTPGADRPDALPQHHGDHPDRVDLAGGVHHDRP